MKPSLLMALLALLILAAMLAACTDEQASSPDTDTATTPHKTASAGSSPAHPMEETTTQTPSTSPTIPGSSPAHPMEETTTQTPSTSPTIPGSSVSLPDTAPDTNLSSTTVPPLTVPITGNLTTVPIVTTPVTTPAVTTPAPVTTTPVTTLPPEPIENPWVVSCNEYITLRQTPSTSGKKITTIPKGETVDLIEFVGNFAKVRWQRQTGYVMAVYLIGSPEHGSALDLSVVTPVQNYSYEQMQTDLAILAQRYPELITLSSIGQSEEGRDLTLCILGNPDAERKIFLQASIHGREHVVTLLAMCEIDYILSHQDMVLDDGSTVGDVLSEVAIHIVPMSNPDGVTISQTGILPEEFVERYGSSERIARLWKANAKGVDLNANFDADWEDYQSIYESTSPANAGYKGDTPECAAESKALADYLRANAFDLTLSYHTSGSLIYWAYDYESLPEVNEKCYDIAIRLAEKTGFYLGAQATTSTAGLKDYAIQSLHTPSLTMEFALSDAPAPLEEFEQIWARGKYTMLTSALWVASQE